MKDHESLHNQEKFIDEILKIKKARLTENSMSFEDLASIELFSDDEITFMRNDDQVKQLPTIKIIAKIKILKK